MAVTIVDIFKYSYSLISNLKVGNLGTVLHEASRLLADQFDVEPSVVVAVSRFFFVIVGGGINYHC